ncbi:MAG: NAD-binding protein [Pseudomonadota bacterium]
MKDIVWLTMRRLRSPLIVLILTFFLSVTVLVMLPGVDANGAPYRLSFLQAAYFVAFMSTTIGFGEIPYPFTDLQRLVVTFLVFPNVIAWLYSIGAILGLLLDDQFRAIQARNRFERAVRWIAQPRDIIDFLMGRSTPRRNGKPFYILCGFGNTGGLLAEGLLDRGLRVAAIDRDADLLNSRRIDSRFAGVPMLVGSVTDRETLELAGLAQDYTACKGVIAVTEKDHVNLTVAITSKLLRPELPVFARSQNQRVCDNMASFRTDGVVNPYDIFARRMSLAMASPTKYLVQDWLLSVPGTTLRTSLDLPSGHWVVCGLGRFGSRVAEVLEARNQMVTVVDVHPARVKGAAHGVIGRGTEAKTLIDAGIREADGIVAGTGDDVDNLSILLTAHELNSNLFSVARQEDPQNNEIFERSGAGLIARPSLIVARRILALATTPLLKTFLDFLEKQADEATATRLKRRLERILGGHAPNVWLNELSGQQARGLRAAEAEGVSLTLDELVHNQRSPEAEPLRCVCLVLDRGNEMRKYLPGDEERLQEGDRLLFAGRGSARRAIDRALRDEVLLMDAAMDEPLPRSSIGRWLARRKSG